MSELAKNTTATLIPALMYRDAATAIDWLCDAFGFERQAVHAGEDGTIMHAQLTFGNGMIMCGTKRDRPQDDTPFGRLIKHPDEIGGCTTQAPYVVVNDADAIYERAKAAGAEILIDIKDQDYGGRDFTCRDLEGHIWSFGTYDPWTSH